MHSDHSQSTKRSGPVARQVLLDLALVISNSHLWLAALEPLVRWSIASSRPLHSQLLRYRLSSHERLSPSLTEQQRMRLPLYRPTMTFCLIFEESRALVQ